VKRAALPLVLLALGLAVACTVDEVVGSNSSPPVPSLACLPDGGNCVCGTDRCQVGCGASSSCHTEDCGGSHCGVECEGGGSACDGSCSPGTCTVSCGLDGRCTVNCTAALDCRSKCGQGGSTIVCGHPVDVPAACDAGI